MPARQARLALIADYLRLDGDAVADLEATQRSGLHRNDLAGRLVTQARGPTANDHGADAAMLPEMDVRPAREKSIRISTAPEGSKSGGRRAYPQMPVLLGNRNLPLPGGLSPFCTSSRLGPVSFIHRSWPGFVLERQCSSW